MGNEFDSTKAPRNLSARQINYSLYSFFISILSKAVAKIRNNSLSAQKYFIKLPYFTHFCLLKLPYFPTFHPSNFLILPLFTL